ncbi:putative leader peptide [Nonomuraea jiangxiensis]
MHEISESLLHLSGMLRKIGAVKSSELLVARLHVDLRRQASALCAMR